MYSFNPFSKLFSCHNVIATVIVISISCTTTTTCLQSSPTLLKSNPDFIKTSCGATLYPDLCYNTLSPYASTIKTSPMELANAALSVTLNEAESTSTMVLELSKGHELRPREAGAVTDCVENMGDSVDELQQSLFAMKDLQGPDFELKMSNIQTWVSAALTNEDTCMDSFEGSGIGGKVKDAIRGRIIKVSQLTSNALAFVNKLRQRY